MERRTFLKSLAVSSAALITLGLTRSLGLNLAHAGNDLPAGESPVDPATDPVAGAIGYNADKSKIDKKKYPQAGKPDFKSQKCENCALYTKSNAKWGKCQLIAAGVVAAGGWCGSYSKKS